jgi:hypothetical protein
MTSAGDIEALAKSAVLAGILSESSCKSLVADSIERSADSDVARDCVLRLRSDIIYFAHNTIRGYAGLAKSGEITRLKNIEIRR